MDHRLSAGRWRRHRGANHGPWLSERLGQQFIIENRPGASDQYRAPRPWSNAPPDGYTLLFVGLAERDQRHALSSKLKFNFMRDIAPVAGLVECPMVLDRQPVGPGQDACRS